MVAVVEPVPGAALLLLLPKAGTEPNTVVGVVVVVAALPKLELLAAGAIERNKEVAGSGFGLLNVLQPDMLGSDFALFAFSSSSSGASVSSLTLAPKTGAFPFKEAEKESSDSFFRSVAKLTPVEATWPNGDSDGVVFFEYSVKGGSLTRTFDFLTSLYGNGFGFSGAVVALVALVGDVSSGKFSAGSTRVLLEKLVDYSQEGNLDSGFWTYLRNF